MRLPNSDCKFYRCEENDFDEVASANTLAKIRNLRKGNNLWLKILQNGNLQTTIIEVAIKSIHIPESCLASCSFNLKTARVEWIALTK